MHVVLVGMYNIAFPWYRKVPLIALYGWCSHAVAFDAHTISRLQTLPKYTINECPHVSIHGANACPLHSIDFPTFPIMPMWSIANDPW